MDLSEKDKFGLNKDGDSNLKYHHHHHHAYPSPSLSPTPSGISADWQRGLIPATIADASMASISKVDSFCSTPWEQHPRPTSQSLGFPPLNDTTTTSAANNNGLIVKPVPGNWNPPDHHMSKSVGVFPQPGIGILSPGLSQFPADSAFIERAARFSCFGNGNGNGNGNFTSMLAPFDSSNPYLNSPAVVAMAGQNHPQRNEPANMGGGGEVGSKDLTASGQGGSNVGSPMNSEKNTSTGDNRGDIEVSGSGQEETRSKGSAARKRKRSSSNNNNNKEMEIDRSNEEHRNKEEENKLNLGSNNKNNGKQAKEVPDPPKEDYIHVRARRGQATNSHSLAERVRREKISERMKFLQDLVPGCTKVTGKAVMLDEIINYVQSLQRQVEFLSMKLSAVDPQLDFNLGLLSKDMVQSRASSSSVIGFSPDLVHPFQHPNTQGLMQLGNSGFGPPPPDAFRRAINAQLTAINTFKETKHQMPSSLDEDLHNVLSQMGFGNNAPPLTIQESNDNKSCDSFPM